MKKSLIITSVLLAAFKADAQTIYNNTPYNFDVLLYQNCSAGGTAHIGQTAPNVIVTPSPCVIGGFVPNTTNMSPWYSAVPSGPDNNFVFSFSSVDYSMSCCMAPITFSTTPIAQPGNGCGYSNVATIAIGDACTTPNVPTAVVTITLDSSGDITIN